MQYSISFVLFLAIIDNVEGYADQMEKYSFFWFAFCVLVGAAVGTISIAVSKKLIND